MREFVWWVLASIHLLAGAGWFGAMCYSLFVMHPRARQFFGDDDEQFEAFISRLAQGARWKVVGVLILIAVSGAGLIFLSRGKQPNFNWDLIMIIKSLLWAAAGAVFWVVSWRWWPRRIFALPGELEGIRRRFRAAGLTMITLAGAAMVLGVLAHVR